MKCYHKSLLIDIRLNDMVSGLMASSVQQKIKELL